MPPEASAPILRVAVILCQGLLDMRSFIDTDSSTMIPFLDDVDRGRVIFQITCATLPTGLDD